MSQREVVIILCRNRDNYSAHTEPVGLIQRNLCLCLNKAIGLIAQGNYVSADFEDPAICMRITALIAEAPNCGNLITLSLVENSRENTNPILTLSDVISAILQGDANHLTCTCPTLSQP